MHKKTIVTGHAMVCSGLKSATQKKKEEKNPNNTSCFQSSLRRLRGQEAWNSWSDLHGNCHGKFESGSDTHATMLEDGQENEHNILTSPSLNS